ncbi:MAG: hypothetical protein HGB18_00085 [Candidatus Moranbacteria bacterium]|nr:hypothetical protein [Candidatus Moranbacteria bacterium]
MERNVPDRNWKGPCGIGSASGGVFLIATAVLFDAVWELFLGWFRKAACALRRRAI